MTASTTKYYSRPIIVDENQLRYLSEMCLSLKKVDS